LPIVKISYKFNMWLFETFSFTYFMFFRFIHVLACIKNSLFHGWIISCYINMQHFVYTIISGWTFGLLQLLFLFYLFIYFCGSQIWTQGFKLAKQALVSAFSDCCK
jgi:hypothetical protein